jgi:hypothetical protein
MAAIDKHIEAIEDGDAWDVSDEVVELEVSEDVGRIVTLKLSADNWKKLSREAKVQGVRPGALAATWVLERLHRWEKAKV